ncbi:glutamate ABC transporter substrate-binding protein [Streptomyces boninensis]|uniref:glutamate ABC transporter substrate-binding protein n=1 Tax=Streptomyces boninensis TaxID=2039455 RepID=UPI003B213460
MNLRKVSAAAAIAAALSLTAAACGEGNKGESAGDGGGDKVTIGIKFDQPGLGQKTSSGKYEGFDVDVATYVAKKLGYKESDIEWKETPSPDRENMIKRGDVDFIVATYSINPERQKEVDFAGPYFLAHQKLLVRSDAKVTTAKDLNNSKSTLCSVTGSTSAQNVKKDFAPKAQLQSANGYSECLPGLENGKIDALTTDDSILAGYAAMPEHKGKFKVTGAPLSNENYGIGLKKGDTKLKDKINKALESMVSDGEWEKAVKKNFAAANYKYEPAPKIGDIKQ